MIEETDPIIPEQSHNGTLMRCKTRLSLEEINLVERNHNGG